MLSGVAKFHKNFYCFFSCNNANGDIQDFYCFHFSSGGADRAYSELFRCLANDGKHREKAGFKGKNHKYTEQSLCFSRAKSSVVVLDFLPIK